MFLCMKSWWLMAMPDAKSELHKELALCICTYKRVQLLNLLLIDAQAQTVLPGVIIIVDGDPVSGEVQKMLRAVPFSNDIPIHYVASNHGNQTYQRFLGWRVAVLAGAQKILYLDDDLRIEQPTSIQKIVEPLDWADRKVVAVTGTLDMGVPKPDGGGLSLTELRMGFPTTSKIITWFGTSKAYSPGDVTPAGNRVPIAFHGNPYEPVKWLRGGAMAFRVENLSKDVLSDDIFAMNHLKYGLCEDLIIARRLIPSGEILLAFNAVFRHPSEDAPKAYSSKAYNLGFAIAYSRRWFNDNYRGYGVPKFSDRVALIKDFLAILMLNSWRALISLNRQRLSYVWGFFSGAIYSGFKKPTARNLTPTIDWWADAEAAIAGQAVLQ
jgi:hypothetical protein